MDGADVPWLQYRAESGGRGSVRVEGRLRATLRLECRRCLAEVRWPMEVAFDFRFDPAVREWEEEAGVYGIDPTAAELDLVRPLREEWLLALPEYPICDDGCRGLCPVCGKNLNESECGCRKEQGDSRWEVLREMVSDGPPQVGQLDSED